MKNEKKFKDEVVAEVRKAREKIWKKIKKDPIGYEKKIIAKIKKDGFTISNRKPMKIDFSKLSRNKKKSDNEAA